MANQHTHWNSNDREKKCKVANVAKSEKSHEGNQRRKRTSKRQRSKGRGLMGESVTGPTITESTADRRMLAVREKIVTIFWKREGP